MYDKISKMSIKKQNKPNDLIQIKDPDGHPVLIGKGSANTITQLWLAVECIDESLKFWTKIVGLEANKRENCAELKAKSPACFKLLLIELSGERVDHKTGSGRIAVAMPGNKLDELQNACKGDKTAVLHAKQSLGTPGKASVNVVVVTDPDKYEVSFVDDQEYRKLSTIDPNAEQSFRKVKNHK